MFSLCVELKSSNLIAGLWQPKFEEDKRASRQPASQPPTQALHCFSRDQRQLIVNAC